MNRMWVRVLLLPQIMKTILLTILAILFMIVIFIAVNYKFNKIIKIEPLKEFKNGSDASVYLKELNIIIFDSLEEQKLYEIEKQKENDENNKKRLEEENQIWNQIPGTRS